MSLIKKELTEKSGFTMEFSVSKEVDAKAELEAYKKNVKSINIHGNYTVAPSFTYDGIEMNIVSADYLEFTPKIVK